MKKLLKCYLVGYRSAGDLEHKIGVFVSLDSARELYRALSKSGLIASLTVVWLLGSE